MLNSLADILLRYRPTVVNQRFFIDSNVAQEGYLQDFAPTPAKSTLGLSL